MQEEVLLPQIKQSHVTPKSLLRNKSTNGIERQESLLTPAQSVLSNNFDSMKFGLMQTKEKHQNLRKDFSHNHVELNKNKHKTYKEVLQCEDTQKNINATSVASSSLLHRIQQTQHKVNNTIHNNEHTMSYNEDKLEQIHYMKTQIAEIKKHNEELAALTKEEKRMNLQNKKLNQQLLKIDLNMNAYLQALEVKYTSLNYTRNHYSDNLESKQPDIL